MTGSSRLKILQSTAARGPIAVLLCLVALTAGCMAVYQTSLPKVDPRELERHEKANLSAYFDAQGTEGREISVALDDIATRTKLFAWHTFNPVRGAKADLRITAVLNCGEIRTPTQDDRAKALISASTFGTVPVEIKDSCTLTATVVGGKLDPPRTYSIHDSLSMIMVGTYSLPLAVLYSSREEVFANYATTLLLLMQRDGLLTKGEP